jgi:hypothetical protein
MSFKKIYDCADENERVDGDCFVEFFGQLEGLFAVTVEEVDTCVLENLRNEILVLALNEKCFSKMHRPTMLLTDDKSGNQR